MQSIPRTIFRTIAERRPLIMSVVVLGWSINYLVSHRLSHSTGPELFGVLTAALSTGAAVTNLALLRSSRMPVLVTGAVLILWGVVAVGGLAGSIAHIVGPVPGHGPLDLRPRPVAAPLVFTLLGIVGGAALVLGRRMRIRATASAEKE